jgi:hypothetical protein
MAEEDVIPTEEMANGELSPDDQADMGADMSAFEEDPSGFRETLEDEGEPDMAIEEPAGDYNAADEAREEPI